MLLPILLSLVPQTPLPNPPKALGLKIGQALPEAYLPTIDGKETLRLPLQGGPPTLLIQFASW